MPLRTWTFLKTSSAIGESGAGPGADGAWPRTTAAEERLRTIAAVAAIVTLRRVMEMVVPLFLRRLAEHGVRDLFVVVVELARRAEQLRHVEIIRQQVHVCLVE